MKGNKKANGIAHLLVTLELLLAKQFLKRYCVCMWWN